MLDANTKNGIDEPPSDLNPPVDEVGRGPAIGKWTSWRIGAGLVLGGAGLWLPSVRRLAGALTSLMIFLWVLMLHLPPALTSRDAGSTTAVFEALAFSGITFLIGAAATRKNRENSA